jgi:hypothetical protein
MRRTLSTDEFKAKLDALCTEARDELQRTVELHRALKSAQRELPEPAFLHW